MGGGVRPPREATAPSDMEVGLGPDGNLDCRAVHPLYSRGAGESAAGGRVPHGGGGGGTSWRSGGERTSTGTSSRRDNEKIGVDEPRNTGECSAP